MAPGQSVYLEPGGARIAFDDVKRTITVGDHFHMTLTFERAGPIDVEVEVEAAHGADAEDAADVAETGSES